ncbi:phosphotransferase [Paractinoplanes deccanensis]|uniref:phosphotransferase n=1 Tax=Paractinoplanes deccanensis TaxID=113561 RepID=UPI001EF18F5A|nr:phosphotransferase [Actinoplanes deccanensis]
MTERESTKPETAGRESLGLPFAFGREADVYALGDGRVLRRYRHGGDAEPEAAVMAYAGKWGFPVPHVYEARGTDLVMERLDGPTLAEALVAGDVSLERGATILADLLRALHDLPPMSGNGTTVVHLDAHPENVVLSRRGPVLIDWRNAGDGLADLDTAMAALILGQVAVGAIEHEMGSRAGELLDLFLERAPGDPVRMLDEAVAIKAAQPTLSREEVEQLPVAVARVRGVK